MNKRILIFDKVGVIYELIKKEIDAFNDFELLPRQSSKIMMEEYLMFNGFDACIFCMTKEDESNINILRMLRNKDNFAFKLYIFSVSVTALLFAIMLKFNVSRCLMIPISANEIRELLKSERHYINKQESILLNIRQDEMERLITNELLVLGISSNLKGFRYFREAVILNIKYNGAYIMTKNIYPIIAWRYDTTPMNVERAMRNAIDNAWSKGTSIALYEGFGNSINMHKCKPSNAQFLSKMTDNILLTEEFNKYK